MTTDEHSSAFMPADGLVCAYVLDGAGGARQIDWDGVRTWRSDQGLLWIHLYRDAAETARWVHEESEVGEVVAESMMAEGSRPRLERFGQAFMMNLRGVNLNTGANPEDMVSLRMWVEPARVITLRSPKLMAIQDVRDALDAGVGPTDVGELVVTLAGRLVDRMGPALSDLDDRLDDLELAVGDTSPSELRRNLAALRRQAIALRRYIAPQRDVMSRLLVEQPEWLGDLDRLRMRELQDRVTRYVEELDAARERAAITQEELSQRIAEQMNRAMYILSIVAAIFLPLSLLTGLLGINVGGIPGSTASAAFAIVVAVLLTLAMAELLVFRRMRWL